MQMMFNTLDFFLLPGFLSYSVLGLLLIWALMSVRDFNASYASLSLIAIIGVVQYAYYDLMTLVLTHPIIVLLGVAAYSVGSVLYGWYKFSGELKRRRRVIEEYITEFAVVKSVEGIMSSKSPDDHRHLIDYLESRSVIDTKIGYYHGKSNTEIIADCKNRFKDSFRVGPYSKALPTILLFYPVIAIVNLSEDVVELFRSFTDSVANLYNLNAKKRFDKFSSFDASIEDSGDD